MDSTLSLTKLRGKLDPWKSMNPPVLYAQPDLAVVNIDGQPGDELALSENRLYRGDSIVETGEVWIYRGGPAFQLDSPSVIIKQPVAYGYCDHFYMNFADFDGDGRTDLAISAINQTAKATVSFYWGDEGSPYDWGSRPADRVISLPVGEFGISVPLYVGDFDGDRTTDFAGFAYVDGVVGTFVYLSSIGKNPRTRSYRLDDADVHFMGAEPGMTELGYLNDPTHQYAMLTLDGEFGLPQTVRFAVSGGPKGPDNTYEAYYAPGSDGLDNAWMFGGGPTPDVTGDGYDDAVYADEISFSRSGVAYLLAGGPYIPRDSTSLGVRDITVAGRPAGLSLYPNPIHDELTIAWRGDLKQTPARFEVHDLLGQLTVASDVEEWHGSALWRCAGVPAGTYLLTVYDRSGAIIATAPLIKVQ
jgi:hypothetical protein